MDDRRAGRLLRQIRVERGWRQTDVATRAGVSQALVSAIEAGDLEHVSLPALRRVGSVLDCRVGVDVWWRGRAQDRLLDRGHAALVEWFLRRLAAYGWEARVEVGFNHFGERGSADIVAWHALRRALAIVEAKTRFDDLQAMHSSFDRKVRILPPLLAEQHGWEASAIGRILVTPGTRANRTVLERHATTIGTMWPETSRITDAWLASATATDSLGGVLLVPPTALPAASLPRQRVRAATGR